MSKTPPLQKEPLHLLFPRALVYAAAVFLFLGPLTAWPATFTAVGAAVVALILSHRLAVSRLRTPILLAAAAGCALLGVGLQAALGGSPQVAAALGIPTTLALTEAVLFGGIAFGAAFALRILAARRPVLAILEVAVVAVAVVQLFAGHRDYKLGQPRFFSDWAFGNGYDPVLLLRVVGVATLASLGLLLLPKRRLAWTLAALGLLAVVAVPGGWIVATWARGTDDGSPQAASAAPPPDPMNFDDSRHDDNDQIPRALVTFHDDFEPVDDIYHLRERTYSVLHGFRLVPSPLDASSPDVPQAFPHEPTPVGGERLPDWMSRDVDVTVALLGRRATPLCLVSPVLLTPRDNPDPSSFWVVYDCKSRVLIPLVRQPSAARAAFALFMSAASPPPAGVLSRLLLNATGPAPDDEMHPYLLLAQMPAGDPAWSDDVRRQYLEYPDDPRYLEFSNRIIADAVAEGRLPEFLKDSPFARALVLMDWIKKNTLYTKRPGNSGLPDPTADFLFGSRKGFCVHVAHAMAFLLRAQGVPTRVAGGFATTEGDRPLGSSILFTGGDAHAWCEVYLQGAGWVPIDGSPEQIIDPPSPRPDTVVQQRLVDRENGEAPPPAGKTWLDASLEFLRRWLPISLGCGGAALLIALYGVKAWRRLAPRLAPAGQLYRVAFRAVLDRLAEVGVRRRFGETREDFALRLAALGPEFAELTAGHVRQAVADRTTFDQARWESLRARVEGRIARAFPLLRRLIGALNPVSWVGAR